MEKINSKLLILSTLGLTSSCNMDSKQNKKIKNSFSSCLVLVVFLFLVTSCEKNDIIKIDDLSTIDFGGNVQKIENLGSYSLAEAVQFLQLSNLPGKVETTTGFSLHRITYKTKNFNNSDIWVSGLLAIPDGKNIKGIVSWQHGTNPDRNESVSKPSPGEGIALSALFAGDGYVFLAADYIGLGTSQEIPTYLHTESTVSTIIDFLKIGYKVASKVSGRNNINLYLCGFSQGGSATAGVHRELEISNTTGLTLKSSACVAGAYNLKDISIPYAIANNSRLYLGYVANSFSKIYNQDIGSIITPNYVTIVPTLFNGSKNVDEIEAALPANINQLYTPSIITAINNGTNNWFTNALELNETYKWKPDTKVRLFYGTEDKDVSPEDAISAYNYMKNLGGNIEIINIGNFDHNQTLLQSLPPIQKWFNETK